MPFVLPQRNPFPALSLFSNNISSLSLECLFLTVNIFLYSVFLLLSYFFCFSFIEMLHFSLLLFLNLLFFFSSFTFFVKFLSSSLLYSSLLFVSWAFLPVRPNDPPGLNPLPPLCLLMAVLALVAEGFWKACKDLMLNSAQGSVISAAPRDVSSPSARHTWPAARTPRHTEKMKLSECVACDPLLGHGTLVSFVWSSVKQTFLFFHFPLF